MCWRRLCTPIGARLGNGGGKCPRVMWVLGAKEAVGDRLRQVNGNGMCGWEKEKIKLKKMQTAGGGLGHRAVCSLNSCATSVSPRSTAIARGVHPGYSAQASDSGADTAALWSNNA